tara:strand:- start:410 stop:652 length:243 start_codon:yes stop_codon:yes gene_type:complete
MTYVFRKELKLAPLKVEYVVSSITNEIKIVDMWYAGKPTKLSYMSNDRQLALLDELENDYLNREKEVEWLEGKMDLEFAI